MPFKSEAQRRWMWSNLPDMARRWEKETPKGKLPKRKRRKSGAAADELKKARGY